MNVFPMFATPLGWTMLEGIDDDALIEYSKKFLIYDDGEAAHSLRGEYIDVSSPLGPLAAQVVECANYMHRKTELKGELEIRYAWCNYSTHKDITKPHTHVGCHLVAIYYPQASDVEITFINPLSCMENLIAPDLIESYNEYNQPQKWVRPEKGMLLIHPAWVTHYVRSTPSERMSIAFDLTISK